jgi:hypothetical protein
VAEGEGLTSSLEAFFIGPARLAEREIADAEEFPDFLGGFPAAVASPLHENELEFDIFRHFEESTPETKNFKNKPDEEFISS